MNFEKYHLAQQPSIKSESLPGPRAQELLEIQDKYESNNRSYPRSYPLVPQKAKGSIIEDVDGNQFLDFFSLCGVLNMGHNNEDIVAEAQAQLEELVHAMDFPTEIKIAFMQNMNRHLPKTLKDQVKINFCGPTGADAIEAALKLARLNSKRNLVIAFHGAYHGMTAGALSVTGNLKNRRELPVINQGTHFAPFSYCYRCPFGKRPDSCKTECATHLNDLLENPHSGVDKPAAVLMETIQGEGGVVIPRADYHQKIQKICNDHEVTLIHDEVQVGFFRTGKLLASEHFGATPDIVTMSKGIGGIGMPLAILLIKNEFDTWGAGTHAGTFRGNQVSIASGNAALNFVDKNDLGEHVADLGELLLDGLNVIKSRSAFIGDVRGLGLIAGVEYVTDKETREPFAEFCVKLRRRLFENGIIIEIGGHYNNVIRILPPLVTTPKMLVTFLETYDRVNEEIEREYVQKSVYVNV